MVPDDLWQPCQLLRSCRSATCTFRLGLYRQQVPVIPVPSTIFMSGKKPLGNQDRFVARQLPKTIKEIPGDPAIWAVDVVIGGYDIDIWYHGAHGLSIIINLQT